MPRWYDTAMSGFHTTRWSIVRAAGGNDPDAARPALEVLAQLYWQPLFVLAHRSGRTVEESEDLVQSFFAGLVEGRVVGTADPERGSFRSYLLGAFKHHMSHDHAAARTEKRGGGRRIVSIDSGTFLDFDARVAKAGDFDQQFDRAWALAVIDEARRQLKESIERRERKNFHLLWPHLTQNSDTPYRELATLLHTTEVAARVSVHRLRKRFAGILRQVVTDTLDDGASVEDEIRSLFGAFS